MKTLRPNCISAPTITRHWQVTLNNHDYSVARRDYCAYGVIHHEWTIQEIYPNKSYNLAQTGKTHKRVVAFVQQQISAADADAFP